MVELNNSHKKRRQFLKGMGAVGATAAIGGCIGGGGGDGSKPATVSFDVWGGTWQDLCIEAAIDPFTEETGVDVEFMIGSAPDRYNKHQTQKDNPPTDLTQTQLDYLVRGQKEDLWLDLDSDIVPVYADVPDIFKDDGWLAHHFTASSIVYNSENVDSKPTDMGVFLDPEYKGRIALAEPNERTPAFDLMAFSLYKTDGETYKDIEAGFEMYEEILQTMEPKFGPATEQYGQWFETGEIDIARIWAARSASWSDQGIPLQFSIPKNGAMIYAAGHAIPANIPENKIEWVGKLIESFMSPEASKQFANQMYYPTVNPNVTYSEDIGQKVPLMDSVDSLILPDYDWLAEGREEWTERALNLIGEYT